MDVTLIFYIFLFTVLIIVQERLTKEIAIAVTKAVEPAGVAVVVEGV